MKFLTAEVGRVEVVHQDPRGLKTAGGRDGHQLMFRGRNVALAGNFKDWTNFGDARAFIEAHILPVIVTSIELKVLRAAFVVEAEAPVGWATTVRGSEVRAEEREFLETINLRDEWEHPWMCFHQQGAKKGRVQGVGFHTLAVRAPLTNKVAVLVEISKSSPEREKRDWLVKVSMVPGEFVDIGSEDLSALRSGDIVFYHYDTLGEWDSAAMCAIITWDHRERMDLCELERLENKVRANPDDRVYRREVNDTYGDQFAIVLSPWPISEEQAQLAWNSYLGRGSECPVLLQQPTL